MKTKNSDKRRWPAQAVRLSAGVLTLALAGIGFGQEANAPGKLVTWEEHQKVLHELEIIKKKLGLIEEQTGTQQKENEQNFNDYDKDLQAVKSLATTAQPGNTKALLTGYGFTNFTDHEGETSSFNAGFNPILLWKLSDRLFFEGELEVELEGSETMVALEFAHVSYVVNDYVTLGAGKFLSPNNYFIERLHPAWINKLPDKPLLVEGATRLLASTQLGLQARGAVPVGGTKLGYAVYVSNGPGIATTAGSKAGTLGFKNFEDSNDNKAVGGRLSFFPIPELAVGYSFESARVQPSGSPVGNVDALSHSVDLNYVRDSKSLKGTIDVRGQFVWLNIDNPKVAPLTYDNRRAGGYAQVAWRPSKVDQSIVKNLEVVARYDWLDLPNGAPNNMDEQRWTFGLNYWLGSSTVVKGAAQFSDRKEPGAARESVKAFLLQAAMGF